MRTDITPKILLTAMNKKGYVVFEKDSPFNLNIIGIRSSNPIPNEFNDILVVLWKNNGIWNITTMTCTTLSGLPYLKTPLNTKGTAILREGQYRGAFKIGKHRGKYEALVQAENLVVYRDNDKDDEYDFDTPSDVGMFGINIHHASAYGESTVVGKWSAGCQVLADIEEFNLLMYLAKQSVKHNGERLSYTLLDENEI